MAKTQYSLSDNPALLGAPTGFTINVTDIRVANGADSSYVAQVMLWLCQVYLNVLFALNMDIDADGTH